jgi:hypothetical protein
MVGPGTLNHAQQPGWQRRRKTLQQQPNASISVTGRRRQFRLICRRIPETYKPQKFVGDLITQCRNECHHLKAWQLFFTKEVANFDMELVLANVTIRWGSHRWEASKDGVMSTKSRQYLVDAVTLVGDRVASVCVRATYRLSRYEPVGEGTVCTVVCRKEIWYKDVSEIHITRCHDRKRRYVFGTYDMLGRTEVRAVYPISCLQTAPRNVTPMATRLVSRTFTHTNAVCWETKLLTSTGYRWNFVNFCFADHAQTMPLRLHILLLFANETVRAIHVHSIQEVEYTQLTF